MKRLTLYALLLAPAMMAQTGPQSLTYLSSVDQSQQPYALYLPRSFDPARQYPLVVSLHSEDSNHRLNLAQVLGAAIRYSLNSFPPMRDVDFLVACPLARGTMGYQGIAERDVYDMLADVERRFPVDEDRVYLTGISMGGGGALWLAMTRPDVWAAVAPICAEPIPGSEALAANLLNVPTRLYHGDADRIVPVADSRAWQRRLLDLSVPAAYFEFPRVGHNVWEFAYAKGGALDWFSTLRRNRFPERVRLNADSYRYRSAYWVRIDGLTPGVMGSIDARRSEDGRVRVETRNVDGFTLLWPAAPPTEISIDGAALQWKPGMPLSFTRSATGWRAALYEPAGKRPGAEGPIAEAVSARHIYVYGSMRARTEGELEERRQVAETAATWSTTRRRLTLDLEVKPDTEVTPEELEDCDLVLFGTAETNLLIARFAGSLPLALSPDAADYGLLFVAPVGRRYVLVSSGLPWWTGVDETAGAGANEAPPRWRQLEGMGDYVLFRGSADHVVAEGRFDANWKLGSDAAARMSATGTVTIH